MLTQAVLVSEWGHRGFGGEVKLGSSQPCGSGEFSNCSVIHGTSEAHSFP